MKKFNIKNRKVLSIFLCLVIVCIFTLAIAYSALSAVLTITGSGEVSGSSWDISISNSDSSTYVNSSTGSATFTTPVIEGTTIANYSVSLTKPGDSIVLYFKVNNNGDINAEISSLINSEPVCTSDTGNTADASLVCDNLKIGIGYIYDDKHLSMYVGDVINTDSKTCIRGYSSYMNDSYLKLIILLDESMTSVPSSSVIVSNLKHEIVYAQSDKTCEVSDESDDTGSGGAENGEPTSPILPIRPVRPS